MNNGKILLFYKYVFIKYPKQIVKWQQELCKELGLTGRILIAHEGVNGTVGGSVEATEKYKEIMLAHELFGEVDFKDSPGSAQDFPRLQVVMRETIVNLGVAPDELTPAQGGTHLTPDQVHELLSNKPDGLVVLDTRNKVESDVGKFVDAITPDIKTFRDFPQYIEDNIDAFKDKEVLMYCTGGIRCERATAYLNVKNVAKKVYQIEGGIHRYAEKYPDGFFRGKNYVFDNRIAVKINDDVLGSCSLCAQSCDEYINCLNALCNIHVISCAPCTKEYENTCSRECQEKVATNAVPKRPPFAPEASAGTSSCRIDQSSCSIDSKKS